MRIPAFVKEEPVSPKIREHLGVWDVPALPYAELDGAAGDRRQLTLPIRIEIF